MSNIHAAAIWDWMPCSQDTQKAHNVWEENTASNPADSDSMLLWNIICYTTYHHIPENDDHDTPQVTVFSGPQDTNIFLENAV